MHPGAGLGDQGLLTVEAVEPADAASTMSAPSDGKTRVHGSAPVPPSSRHMLPGGRGRRLSRRYELLSQADWAIVSV